jgi:hypothetical protein
MSLSQSRAWARNICRPFVRSIGDELLKIVLRQGDGTEPFRPVPIPNFTALELVRGALQA